MDSDQDSVSDLKSGATILVGGHGLCGQTHATLRAIVEKAEAGCKDLTVVATDVEAEKSYIISMLKQGMIKRLICSHVGRNQSIMDLYLSGELELELVPEGSLVERLRAGGSGIPAFYTRTGYGTDVHHGGSVIKYGPGGAKAGDVEILSEPRESREFDGQGYIMERAITGDLAIIYGEMGDERGNILCKGTAVNNAIEIVKAAKTSIALVREVVPVNDIEPEQVTVPGIYVHRVVEIWIGSETPILRPRFSNSDADVSAPQELILKRAARELEEGMYVNLGRGFPMRLSDYIDPDVRVEVLGEHGVLGVGPPPEDTTDESGAWVNTNQESITAGEGASTFSSSEAFNMIRGSHLDVAILNAMEVSANGDLANWIIPGETVDGIGGSMDLVSSGSKVIVVMEHLTEGGKHKLVEKCSLPLTGQRVVDRCITDLGVFEFHKGTPGARPTLLELAPGATVDAVRAATGFDFDVAEPLGEMLAD